MGRGGMETKWWVLTWSCACAWLIITIGLLAGSFAVLTPQQVGLKFNAVSMAFDDTTVYGAGRWYVGVGGSFFIYPRSYQYLEFSVANGQALDVWSKDGQQVFVEVSFYYQLRQDRIRDIFYSLGPNYNAIIAGIAAESVRDTATTYNTIEYFSNRSSINAAMQASLSDRIYLNALANVTQFNLLAIDVPPQFEAAVSAKVVAGQNVQTLQTLRASQLTQTQISIINALAAGNITLLNAVASAQGLIITSQAQAALSQRYQTAKANELVNVARDLNLTTAQQILQYLNADVVRGNTATLPTVAVGASGAITGAGGQ